MKILESKSIVTTCPCCKSKLEVEPSDIMPLSIAADAVGFRGHFICPVCGHDNYLIKNSKNNICV